MDVPPIDRGDGEGGTQEVDTYISRRQNTVIQYIATNPIMDLCLEVEQHPGTRVSKEWWDQECLDLEVRTVYRETVELELKERELEKAREETDE